MRNFFYKIAQFMNGRYGHDKLNMALLIFWLVLQIIWTFTRFWVIGILDILVIVLIVYRSLSKNIQKRMYENRKFLAITSGISKKFNLLKRMWHDRKTHRYVKCPYCKAQLRVKYQRGKHKVHCPKCNEYFEKRILL
ncbi:MAG: hypothetical protein MR360_05870 [Ruminococcus sp.]|nr:hypothetical protein [Ruminococcus sp.]MCI5598824.1 hypothetical protein [Ruminococcus sp.]MCI6504911.1 hypothetical protein [Ruminococcus sp.]MDD6709438.1 hypothetical protein [Ruminococcus sp.]